jgi:hypothetical protein
METKMKYRIITDGTDFRVQYTKWYYPCWFTVQRPEDLDNKDFGGPKTFTTKESAQEYINQYTPKPWSVIRG